MSKDDYGERADARDDVERANWKREAANEENEQRIVEMTTQCEVNAKTIKSLVEMSDRLQKQMVDVPALRAYTLEVSTFHHHTLVPLINLVRSILVAGKPENEAQKTLFDQVQYFLTTVENKAKFYDGSPHVIAAKAKAAEELAKLTRTTTP